MRIAVAGATGRVGRHVVEVLAARGHEVVPISRKSGVDLVTGSGLGRALEGAACVVDAASGPSPEQRAATEFFTTVARNLQEAGAKAGVSRIVVVSIIGIDRFGAGYMAAKRAQEEAARAGPVPVRVLRAAQFHEFVGQLLDWGRQGATSHLPRMQTQLVAARTVAEELARLATGEWEPSGAFLEVAGPKVELLPEAAARLAARRGDAVRIEAISNAVDAETRLYEAGALLPGPGAILAGPTFDAWLGETYGAPTAQADHSERGAA